MKTASPDGWYAFHFGSKFASSPDFSPERLFDGSYKECCVLFADFCSFTAFIRATESIKVVEKLLTNFYTQARKIIHKHAGMLYQIVGDSVVGVWGLHSGLGSRLEPELETASELVQMTRHVAEEWQSHIDLLIEPKGLRLGLAKGSVMVIPRDGVYPGMLLFGNPLNLAARLQAAADPDQLVCSNAAYREIERADLKNRFKPYHCESTNGLLDAKNFGPLKAWTLSLSDKRLIQRRLADRDAEFRNRRNRKNAAK